MNRPRPEGDAPIPVLGTRDVLLDEFAALWPDRPPPDSIDDYRRSVLDSGQAALCLSGGGIRSAAFALGVIQALAAKGLLTRFHYLSTVSGGGYIGSWLSRWIADTGGDADAVEQSLRESVIGTSGDPPQIKHLRANSNYITPRVGVGSTDTWTAIALSVRNILVNWMIFGPALMLVVLLFNAYEALFLLVRSPHQAAVLLAASAVLLMGASFHGCRDLPSYASPARGEAYLFGRVAAPALVWALAAPLLISPSLARETIDARPGAYLSMAALLALGLGYLGALLAVPSRQRRGFLENIPVWLLASGVSAGALLLGVTLVEMLPGSPLAGSDRNWRSVVLGTLGPLWVVVSQLLVSVVFAAFRVIPAGAIGARGELRPDLDREWLARLSALKIRPALLWTILACTCLLVPMLLPETAFLNSAREWISGAIATVSGLIAVLGGKSGGTSSGHERGIAAAKPPSMQIVITGATLVFAVFLFAFLAMVERRAAGSLARFGAGHGIDATWAPIAGHAALAVPLALFLWLSATRINVNRFSLNGLYRNRLARAFLGGARARRFSDPFTGFDENDNLALASLDARSGGRRVLLPVINVALNIVGGNRLAWQERKAEPFVFTPLACGSAMLDPAPAPDENADPRGAYIATASYGGGERDIVGPGDQGVTLATATSISGAAASPSMGYHSSAATSFLMTLFNVRLGAWLPNPARAAAIGEAIGESGPTNALRPLLSELAGLTNDKGDNVYLSDGGHFENLGLYEMIRRRCRFIVVVDAGCDPGCRFEDLGNAIRKISIDQDRVDISFSALDIYSRDIPTMPRFAFAMGAIRYPERPDDPGRLLYIKPSYFEPMPIDIRAYAEVHASFPHEPTADQWFGESQFESYRRLGEYLTMQLGAAGGAEAGLKEFFDAVSSPR